MVVNGRFLTQRVTGVQRFAREISRAALSQNIWDKTTTRLAAPGDSEAPPDFGGLPVDITGTHRGHVWEQLDLPAIAGNDALINLCNSGPMFRNRQLIVLHDAAVAALPENFTLAFKAWYQVMIRIYGRNAKTIGTVSRFSADEIIKHFGIPANKIEIIPESGEHILDREADLSINNEFSLENNGYFLAVSSISSHKNFSRIVAAASKLKSTKYKFVVVGGKNDRIFNADTVNLSGAIEIGYVSDAQLRALYENAACFVYPSTYEGFGLPPLEAMSCGCPVIAANAASLPEVCGPGAAYCDPYDADDIARQISRVLGSLQIREELRIAGLARAKHWTWAKAAHRLGEIDI